MSLPTSGFDLNVQATDGHARCAVLRTPRNEVATPAFMPVGTQATVKACTPDEVAATGAQIVLANTYHLWVRPGAELIHEQGGIHRFMRWSGSVLTDSGGFQVFSLAKLRKIDPDGVTFRSHLDGSALRLTPEVAMDVQTKLGTDIAMVLDVCPPAGADPIVMREAMELTTRWAERCLQVPRSYPQARFGIVQGGVNLELRQQHLSQLAGLPVDGLALGGFSVGEPVQVMYELLQELVWRMPADRPRYLMGVGTPQDLLVAIGAGLDMFDCVLPTRNARNGQALTWNGRVNMRQARHARDSRPVDAGCACPTCTGYSRAYLRHLFRAKEMLGPRLVTQHNLHFYGQLMHSAREAIAAGRYASWSAEALLRMREGDEIHTEPG